MIGLRGMLSEYRIGYYDIIFCIIQKKLFVIVYIIVQQILMYQRSIDNPLGHRYNIQNRYHWNMSNISSGAPITLVQ